MASLLVATITLLVITLLLVKNPFVQTVLARIATNYLENQLQTTVRIDKLEIKPLKSISLKNLLIKDQQNDTLIYTGSLTVTLQKFNLKHIEFKLKSIKLADANIYLRKYLDSTDVNFAFILNYFTKEKQSADSLEKQKEEISFDLDEISISNCRFIYEDQHDTTVREGINFKNIGLVIENFETGKTSIIGDTVNIDIRQLKFEEKSGFKVNNLSCNFTFSPNLLQAENLLLQTDRNDLDLDFSFSYNSMDDYNDFIHKVNIWSNLRSSVVNLYDVGYFAPVLFNMDNEIKISGNISGTVDNFKAQNLNFEIGKNTQFNGNIRMNGLPDFNETFSHLSIKEFYTTAEDIVMFNLPIESNHIYLPELLNKLGIIKINGKFTGFYNDFVSYGRFTTDIGTVTTDILLKVNKNEDIEYKGKIATVDLAIGKLLEIESYLDRIDLTAEIRGSGFDFETMDFIINGTIHSLGFYDNIYNQIILSGSLNDKKFTGTVGINDELVQLDFNGIVDYSQTIPSYDFIATIKDAQLQQMNLVKRDSSMSLSTTLYIKLTGNQIDNLQGIVKIDSTKYSESGKQYTLNDFTLSITRDGSEYAMIRLFSDIVNASLEGKFLLREMPYHANLFLNQYMDTLFSDLNIEEHTLSIQDFIFDIELKNTTSVTELFLPDLKVSPGTKVSGGFNSRIKNLFFDASSDEIDYKGTKIKNWDAEFHIQDDEILLLTYADQVFLTDTLSFDSLNVVLSAGGDSLGYSIKWNNNEWQTSNNGDIEGYLAFFTKNKMELKINRGEIIVNDTLWTIAPSNFLLIDTNSLTFSNFSFYSSEQGLLLDGKISHLVQDTLLIGFDNFNLSNSDQILSKAGVDLDGRINGDFKIVNFYQTPNYLADLAITDLSFNKEKLGEAVIKSNWDPQNEAFTILAQIIYQGNIGKSKTLEVTGAFYPNKKSDNFDINILLNNYKLNTVEPFVKDFSSKIDGLASGELKLTGSTEKPDLTGTISLMRAQMKIDYLNVTYFLADKIHFKENLIYFDNIIVYDSLSNQAIASGKIVHDHFKDFNMDLNFTPNKLSGLNTNRSHNESFYGAAFASGTVRIAGPLDNLTMDINIKSEKGTNIKIPVSYGTSIAENDYIIFINQEEETEDQKNNYEVDLKGISLNLNLNVTHDANVQLFLPYQMGNIQANGKGDLIMGIVPGGGFVMNGEYIINRGSFFLTLQKILNRDFDIRRGSKVTWTGDPYNAQIDLRAVYKVKTTLGDFAPAEDSATRVQVNCVIALSKNLFNPEIRFTIEFPELKDDTKQTIYSQLDTNDQAMMSQQMISLLLLNSFYNPSGTTGSVGLNTFSLVTNQLNNWLSNFSENFDVGINYRPGSEVNSDEVEVALSTQLFNERVIIDGNLGVKGKESSTNNSNLIGEVNVEVKITDDGRFRGKFFNKSNNNYLYKNYAPYTQGVGVFYTQDFNRFGDLFKRKKKKEKENKQNTDEEQSKLNN